MFADARAADTAAPPANHQIWPWVVSGVGLFLAVLISSPGKMEPFEVANVRPEATASRVKGWRGTAVPPLLGHHEIPNFGYHGIIEPHAEPEANAAALPAIVTTIDPGPVAQPAASRPVPEPAPRFRETDASQTIGTIVEQPFPMEPAAVFLPPEPPWGLRALWTPPRSMVIAHVESRQNLDEPEDTAQALKPRITRQVSRAPPPPEPKRVAKAKAPAQPARATPPRAKSRTQQKPAADDQWREVAFFKDKKMTD
jgi:hypothetical protein